MKLLVVTSDTVKYYKVLVIVKKCNGAYFFNEGFDYNLYWFISVYYVLLRVTSVLFCLWLFFFFFFAIILSVRLGVPCWFSKATYWYVSVIFLMSWQDLVYSNSQSPHSKGMLTMRYLLHTASMGIHEAMFVVDSTHSSFFSSLLTGWPLYLHWCKADLLL